MTVIFPDLVIDFTSQTQAFSSLHFGSTLNSIQTACWYIYSRRSLKLCLNLEIFIKATHSQGFEEKNLLL
jgi:hypothetical protein